MRIKFSLNELMFHLGGGNNSLIGRKSFLSNVSHRKQVTV